MMATTRWALLVLATAPALGCQEDPQYIQPPGSLEIGLDPLIETVTATVTLPIELETMEDAADRAALATRLMMPVDQVPYVRLGDFSVALEFTLRNLTDQEGQATVKVNGGNQYFFYVPSVFVIDPDEDEEPPPLLGGYPIDVAGGAQVSDVFREDELREASIDLEIITRGGGNPFAAILQSNENITEWQPVAPVDPTDPTMGTMPVGNPISIDAFSQMVRFDIELAANRHMILEYGLRIRDHRGILHDYLLDAPMGELTVFAPTQYAPAGVAP